jgi:hypothetical protein
VAVAVTGSPSSVLPGQVVGAPLRIPAVLLCTQGERWCGARWVANDRHELVSLLAARRNHEDGCQGGLILVTA